MDNLFELDAKGSVTIAPEALVFLPFKKLWSRDKSKGKGKAAGELGYVWYMCNRSIKKNPYYARFMDNEDGKSKSIAEDLFDDKWKPDKLVEECITFFNRNNYKESEDTRDALISAKSKLKTWFKQYDPMEDADGIQLQRNTKSIQELTKAIKEYDAMVLSEEEADGSRVTGGGEVGAFEDM